MFLNLFVKDKKAFTLVELVVVVGIIGILSAIAIPSFRNTVYKTRQKEATRRGSKAGSRVCKAFWSAVSRKHSSKTARLSESKVSS